MPGDESLMGGSFRWQNIFTVSGATLLSRLLGLARDSLTATWLGLGPAANAFLFAFAVPNLFRRLLGEGALSSALIPVLTRQWDSGGPQAGFRLVNQTMSRGGLLMLLAMIALLIVYSSCLLGLPEQPGDPLRQQWRLGLSLGMLLVPYLGMVCLAAVFAAALNVLGRFAIPALTAVWLNLLLIAALALGGAVAGLAPGELVWWVACGALLGGLAQLLAPAVALWRLGWRPALDFAGSAGIEETRTLFLPAVYGAAVGQLNVLIARLAGFLLNTQALTALYLANRLVELPLGLFALAITTVAFPALSRAAAAKGAGASAQFFEARRSGLGLIFALMLPATVGLMVLAEPIIAALFGWGRFEAGDIAVTFPLLQIFALALPAYALATFEVRVCHAKHDMRTPLRWAGHCLWVNLVLTVLLGPLFGAAGLAWANVVSAWTQALGLLGHSGGLRGLGGPLAKVGAACAAMGVGCVLLADFLMQASAWVKLIATIPSGAGLYLLLLMAMRYPYLRDIRQGKGS
ncbi:MAG: murein biosynthesis integral membrane protein MurJ [Opitutales bacterium]